MALASWHGPPVQAGGLRTAPGGHALLSIRGGRLAQTGQRQGTWANRHRARRLEAAEANVCVTLQPPPWWDRTLRPEEYKVSWHFYLLLLHFVSSRSCSWNMLGRPRVGRRAGQEFTTPAAPVRRRFWAAGSTRAGARGGRAETPGREPRTRTRAPRATCGAFGELNFGTSLFFQKPDPPPRLRPAPSRLLFLLLLSSLVFFSKEIGLHFYPPTSPKPVSSLRLEKK